MLWLGIIGIISLILGLIYLLGPGAITKLDELGKNVLISIDHTLKYHIWVGIFFAVAGAVMIYLGFTIR